MSPRATDMGQPHILPVVLFGATYLGLAAGRIPRLALDRTGCALLGAIAFLVSGTLDLGQAAAGVDTAALAVLFGMMLLSEQYHLSGLYAAIGARLARVRNSRRLLAGIIVVAAALSAFLTNDVICFALTPLIARGLLEARRDPLPYLLALAMASNLGSALTPIGNPQNILIAQRLHLSFLPFIGACAAPVVLSLALLYLLLVRRVAGGGSGGSGFSATPVLVQAESGAVRERGGADAGQTAGHRLAWLSSGAHRDEASAGGDTLPDATTLDQARTGNQLDSPAHRSPRLTWPAVKAIALTAVAVALFVTPIPQPLTALGIAGGVLLSRRAATRALLEGVDWPLLALFVSLFVVVRGFEVSGWAAAAAATLAAHGAALSHPSVLVTVTAVLSNLVSNVPATMLLLPLAGRQPGTGYALALASTFAGNALLVGSIANLIVAERAAAFGIRIGFRDHLRIGLPLTLASLSLAAGALALER